MKYWILLFSLAVTGLTFIPDTGEACFRRRCPPPRCQPVELATAPSTIPTVTIKGKTYRLLDTIDQGEFSEPPSNETVEAAGSGISDNDVFKGTDRKIPKTTVVDADVEVFGTVAAFLNPQLRNFGDKKMMGMGITRMTNTRVDAEKRNVQVTGFIHAFKKESDNDYHVILGDGSNAQNSAFLNVEVSGIPTGGLNDNRKRLIAVREQFKQTFNLGPTGPNGYKRPHEPIPVKITGSLFWDVDHAPGAVGPSDMKPTTSWEIHPVSAIEFLDN